MKKIILLIVLFLLTPKTVHALSCSTLTVDPTSGPVGTAFTVSATNCNRNEDYVVFIESDTGSYTNTITQSASGGGNLDVSVGPVSSAGTYTIYVGARNFDDGGGSLTVTVTEAEEEEPFVFQCGDTVPFNTPTCGNSVNANCCPQGCNAVTRPGAASAVCGCGMIGERCCPGGGGGSPGTCGGDAFNTLVCNASTNTCEIAGEDATVYECGQTVPSSEVVAGTASCPGQCALEPRGTSYWCSCGGRGQSCCPSGTACQSGLLCQTGNFCFPEFRPDTISARDDLPKPNCKTTDGKDGANTAFGCIPFETVELAAQGNRYFIGIAGAIALILIARAAFLIMTSQGDPARLAEARDSITNVIGGLLMLTFAAAILRFVGQTLLGLF